MFYFFLESVVINIELFEKVRNEGLIKENDDIVKRLANNEISKSLGYLNEARKELLDRLAKHYEAKGFSERFIEETLRFYR